MMRSAVALLALIAVMPLPASDYLIKAVKILPIESYPARAAMGAITIAADPYPDDAKSSTAFDVKDLNSRGYFSIHIIIENASATYVTLRTRNIQLITAAGEKLYATPSTLVVEDVARGSLGDRKSDSQSGGFSSSAARPGSPLVDFTTKELTNRHVEPTSVTAGFLFFYTPQPKKPFFAGSRLWIPELINEDTQKPFGPFDIPLDPALGPSPGK